MTTLVTTLQAGRQAGRQVRGRAVLLQQPTVCFPPPAPPLLRSAQVHQGLGPAGVCVHCTVLHLFVF